jgi:hypothetical protein
MDNSLAVKKISKAIGNLQNALYNIHMGNKRIAVGDLDFAKENAQEAVWILLAELEEKDVDKS